MATLNSSEMRVSRESIWFSLRTLEVWDLYRPTWSGEGKRGERTFAAGPTARHGPSSRRCKDGRRR